MKINPRFLKTHRFLSLLPPATLRKLASDSAALQEFPKGSIVFNQGEPCAAVYLVISGRCESRHLDPSNHPLAEMHGPGDTLGEQEMLHQEPYRSTATVVTRSTLLRIPCLQLREFFDAKPDVAWQLSQSIARRVMEAQAHPPGNRIVALHALSPRIQERALARRLGDVLGETSGRRVLSVHFSTAPGPVLLKDWAELEPALDGVFRFPRQVREVNHRSFEMDVQVTGDPREPGCVAPLLSHLGNHFDYVLLQANQEVAVPILLECLIQADLTYIFLRPDTECLYSFKLLMSQLQSQTGAACKHINPIVCADRVRTAAKFSQECERAGYGVHSIMSGFPLRDTLGLADRSAHFTMHLRRLAREIARCRVGLALSSGAARGLAHIGVIQVLEENGIEIDAVSGSSMGAYVGAVWTYGHDGAACEKIARQLQGRWGLLYLFDPVLPPRRGFLSTGRATRRLRRAVGDTQFLELMRPLRVVATDFETLERVVFSKGEVVRAVEASIAIPGICVPVTMDGRTLLDGSISDPLPVDVLAEMGIERIIAVNTIPSPEHMKLCVECALQTNGHRKRPVRSWLNQHLNYFAHGNLMDILMRANHGSETRVAEYAARSADIVLRPWACDAVWHDFTNPGKYIALGRKSAEEQLAEMKALSHPHEKTTTALALAG